MKALIVVDRPERWTRPIPGAEVVGSRDYLTDPRFLEPRIKVFNLCRSYRYQTLGYYVSLLALARGHKPLPSVTTIRDMRQAAVVRVATGALDDAIQAALAPIKSEHFELSVYFGRNLAKRYDRLAQSIFNQFPAPLLRAEFVKTDQWRLRRVSLLAASDVPESHWEFVIEQAARFFGRRGSGERSRPRFDVAILVNPAEVNAPSNEKALARFVKAAAKLKLRASLITKEDYGRLAEFDALFIRETTAVNHHTYRFASRAQSEGLVVIDDPESIVRCSNKVYQAELFQRRGIPTPRTLIVHSGNRSSVLPTLQLPVVLKKPDSAFSQGVLKAETPDELNAHLDRLLAESDLVVAQEFLPSNFDWRIGVLDKQPLYACRYYMARGHWQIQTGKPTEKPRFGRHETVPVHLVPNKVLELALRSSKLIGSGLYGVDLKEVAGRAVVVEVNDNPNIDAGVEDQVLKEDLYLAIMRSIHNRIEHRGRE